MKRKQIPDETLRQLHLRLESLPPRSNARRLAVQETALTYGVHEVTLYRALRELRRPRGLRRADAGAPRVLPQAEMERFCELIAAIKTRTSNRQGRHLSTAQAIWLLEEHGVSAGARVETAPAGALKVATVNRYLRQWGYDRATLSRPPAAARFQATHSNECWQFDLSPSDLKHIEAPSWVDPARGQPTLMLFSVVDDRSGVSYQEYRCVYGEDVAAGLRFLFAAMSPKEEPGLPFHGIPAMIYLDNGPIARSGVFQRVMQHLGIRVVTHLPRGKDGRRPTARSKGKVERPFRTVKEMHETLYHFHAPETEVEANAWLAKFLVRYNAMGHRSEPHSRIEDWLANAPPAGLREMCSWERYCAFAREPERRRVGVDARVSVDGVSWEVDSTLAGEEVVVWWGLFDNELYVEDGDQRHGPYTPVGAPVPLHRYRRLRKSRAEQRADRVERLAEQLSISRDVLSKPEFAFFEVPDGGGPVTVEFAEPDPFRDYEFPNMVAAKQAIAKDLGMALGKLPAEELAKIDDILSRTMRRSEVLAAVRAEVTLPGRKEV